MRMAHTVIDCMVKIRKGIADGDARGLKEVTSMCTSQLAVEEQPVYFTLALLSYVLAKLIQKPRYRIPRLFAGVTQKVAKAEDFVRKNMQADAQQALDAALNDIALIEKRDPHFVFNIVEKGRTKIAALLYAQGLSLARSVSLTGAQKQEVLDYSGKTMMADRFGKAVPVSERLKYARKILR